MAESTVEKEQKDLNLREEITPFSDLENVHVDEDTFEFTHQLFGIGPIKFIAKKVILGKAELFEISSEINISEKLNEDEKKRWSNYLQLVTKIPQGRILVSHPEIASHEENSTIVFNQWSSPIQYAIYTSDNKVLGAAPNALTVTRNELESLVFLFDDRKLQEEELRRAMNS